MGWDSTTRAVLITRCGSCAESRSRRRSPSFTQADATRGRDARDRALELRQLLGRFISVCHTMAYAHSRGVLHRDLKPANVLLGPYNETLIVDWGLAKVLGRSKSPSRRSSSRAAPAWTEPAARPRHILPPLGQSSSTDTIAGAAFGTPAFMSPEQAEGQLDRLSPASDVYSLGAVLYTLLCGRPPFEYAWCEVTTLLARVKNGEFPAPRQANHRVASSARGHLLEGHGTRRPKSGMPALLIWPTTSSAGWATSRWPRIASHGGRELARWGRRHRPLVAGAAVLLVTAVAGLSLGLLLLGRAQRETEAQRRAAVREKEHGHLHVGRGHRQGRVAAPPRLRQPRQPGVSRVPRRQRRPGRSRFSTAAPRTCGTGNGPTSIGWAMPSSTRSWPATRPSRYDIWSLAFRPDGRRLVSGSGPWFQPHDGPTGGLVVREVETGREVFAQHGWKGAVQAVAFSPDGKLVAAATGTSDSVTDADLDRS